MEYNDYTPGHSAELSNIKIIQLFRNLGDIHVTYLNIVLIQSIKKEILLRKASCTTVD